MRVVSCFTGSTSTRAFLGNWKWCTTVYSARTTLYTGNTIAQQDVYSSLPRPRYPAVHFTTKNFPGILPFPVSTKTYMSTTSSSNSREDEFSGSGGTDFAEVV